MRQTLRSLWRGVAGASDPLLAEVARGGASFRNVVFTRNRRVMVSVGDGGRTLRLHQAFAGAPPDVLRSVGVLVSGERRGRARARREVDAFISTIEPLPSARRPRRIPPTDRPALDRLRDEFHRVNQESFAGELPSVPLYLSGRMRRRNGHFSANPPEIVISRRLCFEGEVGESEQTLRHEMIHLWQHVNGLRPGHGREFREWARRLDVHPRATRQVAWRC